MVFPAKKKARLNCIHHLLSQMPYEEVELPVIEVPQRERQKDYSRGPVPQEIIVPEVY
ncbi:Polyphosphate:ADP phosphotransferase [compost metagenome]